jgi:hypothetical protein
MMMEVASTAIVITPYVYTKEKAERLYDALIKTLTDGGMDEEGARRLARHFAPPVY